MYKMGKTYEITIHLIVVPQTSVLYVTINEEMEEER